MLYTSAKEWYEAINEVNIMKSLNCEFYSRLNKLNLNRNKASRIKCSKERLLAQDIADAEYYTLLNVFQKIRGSLDSFELCNPELITPKNELLGANLATEREITSSTYKRAIKRLEKSSSGFLSGRY